MPPQILWKYRRDDRNRRNTNKALWEDGEGGEYADIGTLSYVEEPLADDALADSTTHIVTDEATEHKEAEYHCDIKDAENVGPVYPEAYLVTGESEMLLTRAHSWEGITFAVMAAHKGNSPELGSTSVYRCAM